MNDNKMGEARRKIGLWSFYLFCIVVTFIAIYKLTYEYTLNKDVTRVKYKQFFETEEDIVPYISLCFKNPFIDDEEMTTKYGVNSTTYLSFLKGDYYDSSLSNVNFDQITIHLKNYAAKYWMGLTNGTHNVYNRSDNEIHSPIETFTGFLGFFGKDDHIPAKS